MEQYHVLRKAIQQSFNDGKITLKQCMNQKRKVKTQFSIEK